MTSKQKVCCHVKTSMENSKWCQNLWKVHYDVKNNVMTWKVASKLRQKVWHDVKMYVVMSKSMPGRQKVRCDVKKYWKYIMISNKYIISKSMTKGTSWCQNVWQVRHDVKMYVIKWNVWKNVKKYIMDLKLSKSKPQRQKVWKVCHDIKTCVITSKRKS